MHARSGSPPDDKSYNIYDPSMVLLLAHHQVLCYCSLAKPDSPTKVSLTSRDYGYGIVFVASIAVILSVVCIPRPSVTPRSQNLSSSSKHGPPCMVL